MSERKDEANAWRLVGDAAGFVLWACVFYLLGSGQFGLAVMLVIGGFLSTVVCRAPDVAGDIEHRAKAAEVKHDDV